MTDDELREQIEELRAKLVGFDARVSAVERRANVLETRADKSELDLKNQSRWLQEFSQKLSNLGRECSALQLTVNDMHSFIRSKADELLRSYHDTIRVEPPDDDDTDRAIKLPRKEGG